MKKLKKNNQGWYGKMKKKHGWNRIHIYLVDYNTLRLQGYSHHQAKKLSNANVIII